MGRGRWIPVAEEPKPELTVEELEAQVRAQLKELETAQRETKLDRAKEEFLAARSKGRADAGIYGKMLKDDVKKLKAELERAKLELEGRKESTHRVIAPREWRRPLRERDVVVTLTEFELAVIWKALVKFGGSGRVDQDTVSAGGPDVTLLEYFATVVALNREATKSDLLGRKGFCPLTDDDPEEETLRAMAIAKAELRKRAAAQEVDGILRGDHD